MIVDESLTPVSFDWKNTWGGNTNVSSVFAVEGVDGDDTDTNPDFYKLAIKRENLLLEMEIKLLVGKRFK